MIESRMKNLLRLKPLLAFSDRFAVATVALALAASLTACKADSNNFSSQSASLGGNGDGSSTGASTGFRISLKGKQDIEGFIHKFGDVSAGCEVPLANQNTPTSIQCMLNMMEYDMWFYGFEYQVSIPSDFCSYLVEYPYYHYIAEAGYGPSTASIATTNGVMTACSIGGAAPSGGFTGTLCTGAEATISNDGEVKCTYDYSDDGDDVALPNCCAGVGAITVTATTTVTDSATGGTTTTITSTTTEKKYAGKISACVESPHDYIAEWPKSSVSSKAVGRIRELGKGRYNGSQKIPSPMVLDIAGARQKSLSNFLNAGFHDWAAYAAGTWSTTHTTPRAMAPLLDRGNAGTHAAGAEATTLPTVGDGSYDFQCLGPAGELKQRIRVYANEWNTIEDFEAFQTNGDASAATPIKRGTAGVASDCSAVNLGNSCNSIWGWDDIIYTSPAVSGFYGNGVPTAHVYPYEPYRVTPF